ncbi:hypothetical protein [Pseudoalteromonas carrageenovora]|uniref:hypothetical protein n=1 Tax=Pseudoalteromonas carrageenovora TaxID=227 RepID=UPI0026E2E07C|nr:hypothetical protein [Pseudoalteromonas carrageenovora]MDO6547322.1 hypothetical protein [Pseudoalteromonas carrageenovora]MDO6831770.1 hypothetical protein [Pseudoalteromonas carrageenovora]
MATKKLKIEVGGSAHWIVNVFDDPQSPDNDYEIWSPEVESDVEIKSSVQYYDVYVSAYQGTTVKLTLGGVTLTTGQTNSQNLFSKRGYF